MRQLLALFILSMGLQPMPLQACDSMSEAPPAHHAGHGDMTDMADQDEAGADCCDGHAADGATPCLASVDCHHCVASAPALVLPQQGLFQRPFTLSPESVDEGVAHRISAPLYKPPIA